MSARAQKTKRKRPLKKKAIDRDEEEEEQEEQDQDETPPAKKTRRKTRKRVPTDCGIRSKATLRRICLLAGFPRVSRECFGLLRNNVNYLITAYVEEMLAVTDVTKQVTLTKALATYVTSLVDERMFAKRPRVPKVWGGRWRMGKR